MHKWTATNSPQNTSGWPVLVYKDGEHVASIWNAGENAKQMARKIEASMNTTREPSKAAVEAAKARYLDAVRWATGNKRAEPANDHALVEALRAAYAVDALTDEEASQPKQKTR